jgi:uncharacterized MAPEG superfamily protein
VGHPAEPRVTVPLYCLLFFAGWTLGIVFFGLGFPRIYKVMTRQARVGDFPADTPHGSDLNRRIMRAHGNCIENLPVFGAVVLVGHASGYSNPIFDKLAMVYVLARVLQTSAHLSSGRSQVIRVRFGFFLVQVIAVIAMGIMVATQ